MAGNVIVVKKNPSRRKSGGAKKIGRNAAKCKAYRDSNTREINKARKARRHAKRVAKKTAKLAKRV